MRKRIHLVMKRYITACGNDIAEKTYNETYTYFFSYVIVDQVMYTKRSRRSSQINTRKNAFTYLLSGNKLRRYKLSVSRRWREAKKKLKKKKHVFEEGEIRGVNILKISYLYQGKIPIKNRKLVIVRVFDLVPHYFSIKESGFGDIKCWVG